MHDTSLIADPTLARRRKIRVKEAAAINDVSESTFRRRYPHLIRQISQRRQAVELGDAIDLPGASNPPKLENTSRGKQATPIKRRADGTEPSTV